MWADRFENDECDAPPGARRAFARSVWSEDELHALRLDARVVDPPPVGESR
jgi:hypothetical protein